MVTEWSKTLLQIQVAMSSQQTQVITIILILQPDKETAIKLLSIYWLYNLGV